MGHEGDPGFLSRWSRRKVLSRQGEPLSEPVPPPPAHAEVAPVAPPAEPAPPPALEPEAPPPLTLDDVAALSPESDFRPFVARDVQLDVRNAALKKLFTDPHYNVMDGLDTYVDDYSQPDPLPPGMLEQMAQSAFLGLFTEAPADADAAAPSAAAATPETEPSPACHENTDLRLQPDDAAERPGPAQDLADGPGSDPGREP
jgi:hypothetical protein